MGTLTTQAVVTRVATLLQDTSNVRWPTAELVLWVSDAQREIASYKPDAFVKTQVVTLVAGSKQSLPSDGVTLIDVIRNMGTTGTTPGRAPRLVSREILDAQLPTWHTDNPSAEVRHYVFDPANQKTFYVQPPQPSANQGSLEIVYSAAPSEVTLVGNLVLDDTWINTITNYVMHRAYSKDAEYAANANLAAAYYQAFVSQMTGRSVGETAHDPNRNAPIINPNVRQTAQPNPPIGG